MDTLALIYSVITLFSFGLSAVLFKKPAQRLNIIELIFYRGIVVVSLLLFILFLRLNIIYPTININISSIILLFITAIIGFIPLITFYKALEKGKVGIIVTISNSYILISSLLAFIFLNENLTQLNLISIFIILFGIASFSIDFGSIKNSNIFKEKSGIRYALITLILWGFYNVIFKMVITKLGVILSTLGVETIILLLSLFYLSIRNKIKSLLIFKREYRRFIFKYVFLGSLIGAFGSLFFAYSLSIGRISYVLAIVSINPIVAESFSRYLYKERLNLREYLSMVVIVIGIIMLNIF